MGPPRESSNIRDNAATSPLWGWGWPLYDKVRGSLYHYARGGVGRGGPFPGGLVGASPGSASGRAKPLR